MIYASQKDPENIILSRRNLATVMGQKTEEKTVAAVCLRRHKASIEFSQQIPGNIAHHEQYAKNGNEVLFSFFTFFGRRTLSITCYIKNKCSVKRFFLFRF